jgi:cyanophycin synthetase
MAMRLLDSRRLRGPSLGADGPGAIAEVVLDAGEDSARVIEMVEAEIGRLLRALELPGAPRTRPFAGGFAVFVPSAIDVLMPMVDLVEAAIEHAQRALAGRKVDRRRALSKLRRGLAKDRSERLTDLERAAKKRGLPFLFDDDTVTVGHGARAKSWPMRRLPRPTSVAWSAVGGVPVALVTGTNGKTTTVRLVARMAKHAGLVPGNTSSDGVSVGEEVVEAGDLTGGEAARQVLRDPRVEIAILETARGGLLRRGLAAYPVDAALVTNVSSDHLGDNGVLDLETMADAKATVLRAVRAGGKAVVNAGDARVMARAEALDAERVLFAVSENDAVRAHIAAGGHAFVVRGEALVHAAATGEDVLVRIDEVPITFRGAARHNVENALAAAALAWSLGLSRDAVVAGLKSFGSKHGDNIGRGTVVTLASGARALLDFAHNPVALTDVYALAGALRGEGGIVAVATQAGDRSDEDFEAFARVVVSGGATHVIVWEKERLLRGRAPGGVRAILRASFARAGLASSVIEEAEDEREAVAKALRHVGARDLLVVAPYLDRGDVNVLLGAPSGA